MYGLKEYPYSLPTVPCLGLGPYTMEGNLCMKYSQSMCNYLVEDMATNLQNFRNMHIISILICCSMVSKNK